METFSRVILLMVVIICVEHMDSYHFVDIRLNWTLAETYCQDICNSHLASIHSESEFDEISALVDVSIGYNARAWFGLNDMVNELYFVYTDGTPFNFGNNTATPGNYPWARDSPADDNSNGNQDCCNLIRRRTTNIDFNDDECNETYPFLCNSCINETTTFTTSGSTITPSESPTPHPISAHPSISPSNIPTLSPSTNPLWTLIDNVPLSSTTELQHVSTGSISTTIRSTSTVSSSTSINDLLLWIILLNGVICIFCGMCAVAVFYVWQRDRNKNRDKIVKYVMEPKVQHQELEMGKRDDKYIWKPPLQLEQQIGVNSNTVTAITASAPSSPGMLPHRAMAMSIDSKISIEGMIEIKENEAMDDYDQFMGYSKQHEIVLPEMVSPGGSTRGSTTTNTNTNNGDVLTDEGTTDSTNPSTGTDEAKEPSSHPTYSNSPGANKLK